MFNQIAYIGKDAILELMQSLGKLSIKRVLLLRGKKSFSSCGAESVLQNIFVSLGIECDEWFDFSENPKLEEAKKGAEILEKIGYDAIIACGGGSVIDMAKLIRFSHSYKGSLVGKEFTKIRETITLFAIPTTAGTGAEATPFAVCYKDNVKYSVEHKDILPDYAVVYPPFTYYNPPYLTACTGFDALAQATEAYWSPKHTDVSDMYAVRAIKSIRYSLDKLVLKDNSQTARDDISEGAYYAGKAIAITRTTAPHAFSYAFTTLCGYPHGHAVALTFPFFFELNVLRFNGKLQDGIESNEYHQRMRQLCELWGVRPQSSFNQIQTYIESIGLSSKGFKCQSLDYLLSVVNIDRLSNNPIVVNAKIVEELKNILVYK